MPFIYNGNMAWGCWDEGCICLKVYCAVLVCPFEISGYLNCLSLVWQVSDRARCGSFAWARLDTTFWSFFSLCFCLSFQLSSSSSAFFLCSSTFLLKEKKSQWQMSEGGKGQGWFFGEQEARDVQRSLRERTMSVSMERAKDFKGTGKWKKGGDGST